MTDAVPPILPVFPLTGALLLPGGRLPLHIFEQRYRNMVSDALEGDKMIGMIQPFSPEPGSYAEQEPAEEEAADDDSQLYQVGCAGLIERWERLPDGRFIVLLKGVRRFRVQEELPPMRGYRRVEADYADFDVDATDRDAEISSAELMAALRRFADSHQISLEVERLEELSGLALLNSVAMVLPFPPAEKQALLEAPNVEERLDLLLTLLKMGVELRADAPPPTLN